MESTRETSLVPGESGADPWLDVCVLSVQRNSAGDRRSLTSASSRLVKRRPFGAFGGGVEWLRMVAGVVDTEGADVEVPLCPQW